MPSEIILAPEWQGPGEKEKVIGLFVTFLNKYGESAILSGAGRGTHSWFGDGDVRYVFTTMYMPGYEPWSLCQLYTVVENEVIFDMECCSADGNVSFFELPGLWPDGKGPL